MADPKLFQQIFDNINKASRILIPLPPNPSGDNLSAALAFNQFLKKLEKEPQLVCAGQISEKYSFLPARNQIQNQIQENHGFIISVQTEKAPLDELSYHLEENTKLLHIYLKPLAGNYEPSDVSFRSDRFPYDLIITLGTPSLDLLGGMYDDNTDLFFETPIINIDHHSNNEHYGELNLVDITATSATEILMELLESYESSLIDSDIATNLLAGILIETKSFQHVKTTPKAFMKASSLISLGANQQEIIRNLYKTKSINLLKLWGRALARLREVPETGLAYSLLRAEDIAKSGSDELLGVMEELASSLSDSRLVVLLAETDAGNITGYFQAHPNIPANEVANALSAQLIGDHLGSFRFTGKTIQEAEVELLERLKRIEPNLLAKV